MKTNPLTRDAAVYFRDQLREARAIALRDAEAFEEIVYSVERLGSTLTNRIGTLGSHEYRTAIAQLARQSPLAEELPLQWRDCHIPCHIPFQALYRSVQDARNDALHQGAFARHLTIHAVQLALVLEDALVHDLTTVGDYMVPNPVCAAGWQPVGFIRQAMLANSFSYLPVRIESSQQVAWHLISDYAVAQYLQNGNRDDRKKRLATLLRDALGAGIEPVLAPMCTADTPIADALTKSKGGPVLVHRKDSIDELLGIVTPFDLL